MSTLRRKLAIATWDAPREGNIYGKLTVDATELLAFVDWCRQRSGERVTLTTVIGKAVAEALAQTPSVNGYIRFGRYIPHASVDLAFLVALEEGRNLAKVKICDFQKKSVVAVTQELRALAEKLHKGEDASFNKSMGPVKLLPSWLLKPLLRVTGWLTSSLGISVPALGLEAFPFGSCIITNVGVFGLDEGFVPPTPFARTPVYVLIGATRPGAWVVDGQLEVRPLLTLTATIDHRFMDGAQGGSLAKVVRQVLENPWTLEGMEGRPPEQA